MIQRNPVTDGVSLFSDQPSLIKGGPTTKAGIGSAGGYFFFRRSLCSATLGACYLQGKSIKILEVATRRAFFDPPYGGSHSFDR
jgi:hypothetical protein